jgi:hypothetical protein
MGDQASEAASALPAKVKEATPAPAPPTEAKETATKPSAGEKKGLDFGTWIALASAVAAIIAAYIAGSSVKVAESQNVAADQQQLVGITIAIEQAFSGQQSSEDQAGANLTGTAKSAAIANADLAIVSETAADAEAAAVIISDLHGNGVEGIEYVTVARALANYGNTSLAITYFNDAVNASLDDVPVRADALRNEAGLYYALGQGALGHQDFISAALIYNGHLEISKSLTDNSIAQAYLLDAADQIAIGGCRVAATDLLDAKRGLAPLGTNGANLSVQTLTSEDDTAYDKKCIVSS